MIDALPPAEADRLLRQAATETPTALDLAKTVKNKSREKFQPWLAAEVLEHDHAAGVLDVEGARAVLQRRMAFLS